MNRPLVAPPGRTAPTGEGQIIKGKYRLGRLLGEGGMGTVVAAHHIALDQPVAIKFLQEALLVHPQIVERFAREARAASKIQSDHVARVTDVDEVDGIPFMVMEYLDGRDLSFVRREGTPLPIHAAVSYVLEACDAIAEAHRLGIIHRDLKPANLFLARRPDGRTRVKVLDFGISKFADAVGGSQPSMTKTSAVMGSSEYMSPEQMISTRDADPRTDIWALGVTLFELLTGRVPFPGETITHVCALVMTTTADAPSKLRSDVPAGLDDILAKCLMRDRSARYAGVAELVAALAPFAMPQAAQSRESGATLALPGVGVGAVAGTSRSVMDSSGLSSGLSSGGIQDEETALQDDGTASTDRAPAIGASVPSRDLPDIIRTTGFPGSSGTRALPDRPGTRVSGVGLGQAASTTGVVSSEPISLPRKSSSRLWVGGIAALVVGGIA